MTRTREIIRSMRDLQRITFYTFSFKKIAIFRLMLNSMDINLQVYETFGTILNF